jgi:trehalose/maltose hydrolase-like predicted phosphorylase
MNATPGAPAPEPDLPSALSRRFEAAVVDWSAVADRRGDMGAFRALVEELCGLGFDIAVVSDLDVDRVDTRLGARPGGPGRLFLCGEGRSTVEARAGGLVSLRQQGGVDGYLADLWARGIDPSGVLLAGVELHVLTGSEAARAVAVERDPALIRRMLHDQRRRRLDGDVPMGIPAMPWSLTIEGFDGGLERVHESLLTLADGQLGARGSPLVGDGATATGVYLSGVYEGVGPATELARLQPWSRLTGGEDVRPFRRSLDLRTGVLYEDGPLHSIRFSSLARPRTVAMRVMADDVLLPPAGSRTDRGVVTAAFRDIRRGQVFERLGAYDPEPTTAEEALAAAEDVGFEGLLREHREAWARRWEDADIIIDGDPELQRAVRFALFHLMASVADTGEAAVGARGLSGPAYRGHVFWDSDVFVLPFLAATHPAAARMMLEYRSRRLAPARDAARRLGRAGARFPWESAADGSDVTPATAKLPTGGVIPVRTGELEEHIVADVAWAAASYIDWTGDNAFAAGAGRDLLVETARYWASRVRYDNDGRAHIEGVIGPDEYHELVDDNAFTNVMARWNLRRAASTDAIADEERVAWLAAADALVDGYDPRTRLYEQHAGFRELEPIVISEISPRRPIAADLLLGTARTAQAQVIKQPDVLMLHHLIPDEVAHDSLQANLDFYEPRTAHGSSLSPAIHAALLARARRYEPALEWLRVAAHIDLDDLTGSTAGGLHLATMGGLWQAVVFGFAGVRACWDRLRIAPRLPPAWHALSIRLRYRGAPLRVHVTPGGVEVEAEALQLRRADEHWEVVSR